MHRSTDRILTSHVGSLPRPADILARIYAHQTDGEPFDDAYWDMVRRAVADVVGEQKAHGIDIVSDGELGKVGFTNYVSDRLDGLGGETVMWTFHDLAVVPEVAERQYQSEGGKHICMPACVGPLKYIGHAEVARDIEYFTQALDAHDVDMAFMPAVSPGSMTFQIVDRHYGSYEDYVMAIAEAMRDEFEAIARAGFTLQLDATDIPICHPAHGIFWATDVVEKMGFKRFIELNLEALNHATASIPGEQMRLHLCWANYEGPHHCDVPLIEVLEPSLRISRAKTISFEAANPRHEHEWRVFEDIELPDDRVIMPGVIDTTTNFIEHPQLVADRIERFAKLVGRERVIAGTDCGFGTFAGFGEVAPGAAWLKLRSLSEGAAIATDRLWT